MAKPADFPAPSFEAPTNSNTDQYNFTFFKERAEHATPQPQTAEPDQPQLFTISKPTVNFDDVM